MPYNSTELNTHYDQPNTIQYGKYKTLILTELRNGQKIFSEEDLFNFFRQKDDLKHHWIDCKIWWQLIIDTIFAINNERADERMITTDGLIIDKMGDQWVKQKWILQDIDLKILITFLLCNFDQEINYKIPFTSFNASYKNLSYRFTMQLINISNDLSIKIIIRINRHRKFELKNFGLFSNKLSNLILNRNTIISGSTGSGKTSFLKSVLGFQFSLKHTVVIEDIEEIGQFNPSATFLCTSRIGQEMKTLLVNSLRMSPDRIIVGEIRSCEVTPFILALNSGHQGSMATIHANSAVETCHRLCELIQVFSDFGKYSYTRLMKLVTRNIEYIIYMEQKKVLEVIKVLGCSDKGEPYFEKISIN